MFTENVYRAADRGQKAKMTDKVSDRKRIKEENAMKFTEGYWLRSENMAPSYASQGFYAEKTERGMRIVAPERKILNRGGEV